MEIHNQCTTHTQIPSQHLRFQPLQPPQAFPSREALADYVAQALHGLYADSPQPSPVQGGRVMALKALARMDPIDYARSRNYGSGKVTRLSPYIRHGVISLSHVLAMARARAHSAVQITKFIQELAWRDYYQRIYAARGNCIWQDAEDYKTGWGALDYSPQLPEDIRTGHTGVACIDAWIRELCQTGYLHNHARMYVAAYVVHWRRVRWQEGARWFLQHLLDGDPASNNLSWQWVASTFSAKPYIFNLENARRYFGDVVDCSPERNQPLDASYEELQARLFPHSAPTVLKEQR